MPKISAKLQLVTPNGGTK